MSDLDFDLDTLFRTFRADAEEHLAVMEEMVLQLEAGEGGREEIDTLFRMAHSLKGDALCVNLHDLSEFAHVLEDLLEGLRDDPGRDAGEIYPLVLQGIDALREMTPGRADDLKEPTAEQKALRQRIEQLAAEIAGKAVRSNGGAAEPRGSGPAEGREAAERRKRDTLRVDVEKLDRLLNLTGEIAIERGGIRQLLEEGDVEAALQSHADLDRLFQELQEIVLEVRMVPLGPLFRQHVRTVRDLSRRSRKLARLVTEGSEVEVDTAIVQLLRDPLTHLIRNAVDHGLERAEERSAAGKDPVGTVTLRAFHQSGHILVEVTDDGAGLDAEAIVARARELGLLDEGAPAPADLSSLIFAPQLSTASEISEVSGRGVGMDVVRRNVEALRGTLSVSSHPGAGTTVRIRLPLTLLIIEGFAVQVARETYVLPLENVVECLDVPRAAQGGQERYGTIHLRGEPLPFVRLASFFEARTQGPVERESIVVVQDQGRRAGLVVDELNGEHQTVVKSLGRMFDEVPGISASTVLGTGDVALIVDIPQLIETVELEVESASRA
ncbi:MAG: chemotaxis protein CheA [Deltaproteobacteria bacterium]|nr:chemotaxis protein CheA [Deltaproteobacteria bacterium]